MLNLLAPLYSSKQITKIPSTALLLLIFSGCQLNSSGIKPMANCNYEDSIYEAYNWHCVVGDQTEKASCKDIRLIEIVTGKYPGVSSDEQAIVFWKGKENAKLTYSLKVLNERNIMTCHDWSMMFHNNQYTEIFTLLGNNTVYSYGPSGSNVDKSRIKLRPISQKDALRYKG